jgi:YD repeat-containing protein
MNPALLLFVQLNTDRIIPMNWGKKIYLTVAILAVAAYCNAQDAMNLKSRGLLGRVHFVTEYNFTEGGDNGLLDESANVKIVSEFDTAGRLILAMKYGQNDVFNSKSVFHYDSKGRIAEERNYGWNNKLVYYNTYRYDVYGNEIMRRNYKSGKTLFMKTLMDYDDRNNLIQERTQSPRGQSLGRAVWQYDTLGNPVEETTFDPDNVETRRTKYVYDQRGYVITERSTCYGLTVVTNYQYDSLGRLAEEKTFNASKKQEKHIKYIYDNQGREIAQHYFSPVGDVIKTITYKTQYDSRNNMLRKIEVENGRETTLVERAIVYY